MVAMEEMMLEGCGQVGLGRRRGYGCYGGNYV